MEKLKGKKTRVPGVLFRGRRQGRQPLNPGAGPAPVSSPEAFGGNRRLYTLAAPAADHLVLTSYLPRTYLCPIPVHPRSTIIPVIYSVFGRAVFKKHRFLQCFVALAVSGFHLGDVKKLWVFHGFGS